MANIALSSGIRSSLSSLQGTAHQLSLTQSRLSTGRKVNSAIDNPTNFFAAANLNDRADKLSTRLDGLGQAVSTLNAADNALTSMRSLVSALKGVVDEALATSDSADRGSLGEQFNELLVQLNDFSKDADYKGVNLLQSGQSDVLTGGNESLVVQFGEDYNDSTLDIQVVNITGATTISTNAAGEIPDPSAVLGAGGTRFAVSYNEEGVSSTDAAVIGIRSAEITTGTETAAIGLAGTGAGSHQIAWADDLTYQANLAAVVSSLEAFDSSLINTAKALSQNVNIVSIRQDFTNNLINTLEEGADKLTLADLNEEGANLLALQTTQSLGIQSLSLASQTNQAVLGLLG
jgi:flagellin-like hook-associated protein FlgL|tara:strand:+ start:422 stop:1462 length:1041 start_codon:yes stop_codon:yes gene_type:complete